MMTCVLIPRRRIGVDRAAVRQYEPRMIRYDDERRVLTASVGDLVDLGAQSGDLEVGLVQSSAARLEAGRRLHTQLQAERHLDDDSFASEVRVKRQIALGEWTAVIHGRLDGLSREGRHVVVEEMKSTVLDGERLWATELADWPRYRRQVEIYLWILAAELGESAVGRLIFVSLTDSSRQVFGVPSNHAEVEQEIRSRLVWLAEKRERRNEWLAERTTYPVPQPYSDWREGQETITQAVEEGLMAGRPVLVQAPTGLGKTASVLHAALRVALRTGRQVFWATSRNTQHEVVQRTVAAFAEAGLSVRAVTIRAKRRACLNEVIACRSTSCTYAQDFYGKMERHALTERALRDAQLGRVEVAEIGETFAACPYYLALETTDRADLVVGDYNYVFDPHVRLRGLFGEQAGRWIVIVDEAHQLVVRARGYRSPRVEATTARAALVQLTAEDREGFAPFVELAEEILQRIEDAEARVVGPSRDQVAVVTLWEPAWRDFADRIDELAYEYLRLRLEHPTAEPADHWVELGRSVLRFAWGLSELDRSTVQLVGTRRGQEWVGLFCRDASEALAALFGRLGGLVGLSATLSPPEFYRDLLGLEPDGFERVEVGSPFPSENLRVLVAPRVSTTWRDRRAHADATAALLARCIEATPGNTAVYFPSYAMLTDIVDRWTLSDTVVVRQQPDLDEAARREQLATLDGSKRCVLAAVLGGVYAEGVDLPEGALSTILIVGPALPPVGLERTLLQDYYEERFAEGFRYASLIPGMTKVIQAAGRLVRRPTDRGVVVLVGRRFRWRDYVALLPVDWKVEVPEVVEHQISSFWEDA